MLPPPKQRPRPRGLQSSAKQRILAQWRGVDVTPLEIAQKVSARRLGDLVPQVLTGFRVEQRRGDAEIVKVWNNLTGLNVFRLQQLLRHQLHLVCCHSSSVHQSFPFIPTHQ